MTRLTGRSAFLRLLIDEGVDHLFGNPGTTELPIMEVVPDFPAAEVRARAAGVGGGRHGRRLCARLQPPRRGNVHVAPGLGNAMGALYNAKFSGSPMIVTAGQQEQGHGLLEPLLYAPLRADRAAHGQVGGGGDARRGPAAHRAPRGEGRAHAADRAGVHQPARRRARGGGGAATSAQPTRVDARMRPSDEALAQLAARLLAAKNPVILAGQELGVHDAFAEAAELAELLGAAVYQQTGSLSRRSFRASTRPTSAR